MLVLVVLVVVVVVVLGDELLAVVDDQLEESGAQTVGTGPPSTDNWLCSIPQHA